MSPSLKELAELRLEHPDYSLIELGKENLTNSELLSIILKTGLKGENVENISLKLLNTMLLLSVLLKILQSIKLHSWKLAFLKLQRSNEQETKFEPAAAELLKIALIKLLRLLLDLRRLLFV